MDHMNKLPDGVKYTALALSLFFLLPLLLVWVWNNLFAVLGAPSFTYVNGLALEVLGLFILGGVVGLKEVK